MAKLNPQRIYGSWIYGYALDVHSLGSVVSGVNAAGYATFDTTRSELGTLLYRFKYQADLSVVEEIVDCAVCFLTPERCSKIEILVPVPPSTFRAHRPVLTLAERIGERLELPVIQAVKASRSTRQVKDAKDPERRKELLAGLHEIDTSLVAGRNVLLFDDLYETGTTMNTITELLLAVGRAASVRALAITCTRSQR